MKKTTSLAKWGVAVLLLSSLSSCEDLLEQYFPKPNPTTPPTVALDISFYALSENGRRLDAFSTKNPSTPTSSVAITTTGDRPNDKLLGIDFRPATGQLYGVSATSRVYVINPQTGVARLIGSAETEKTEACICADPASVDFDPTTDRIRVVAFNGRNRVMNPETGLVEAIEAPISPQPTLSFSPITAMAYSNSVAGTGSTTLYAINSRDQQLYRVTSAREGIVEPIGKLNLPIINWGGMDIDAKSGTALAVFQVNNGSAFVPTLFTVDLTTGAATTLAQYTEKYQAIAIPTKPVAYALAFSGSVTSLAIIDLTNPAASAILTKPITGIGTNDEFRALDFRPANGQLYALAVRRNSTTPALGENLLYTINAATGAATLVATLAFAPAFTDIGFDFNPVVDRIRIVTNAGQNLRVNPADGTVVEDALLNPSGRGAYAAAYSNNFAGATTTTLYVMGRVNDRFSGVGTLYQQNPPNEGTLVRIGDLGTSGAIAAGGFDIGGMSNQGYALISQFGTIDLYSVDLATGGTTKLNQGGNYNIPNLIGLTVGLGF